MRNGSRKTKATSCHVPHPLSRCHPDFPPSRPRIDWRRATSEHYYRVFDSLHLSRPLLGPGLIKALVLDPMASLVSVRVRDIWSRLDPTTETKSPSFVQVDSSNYDKKSKPLVPVGATNRDQRILWSRLVLLNGIQGSSRG